MAVTKIWKLHSVTLVDIGTPANNIVVGAMRSVAMPTDAEVVREVNASNKYPLQAHTNFRSASINFTSWDLGSLLDLFPIGGLCLSAAADLRLDVTIAQFDCNAPADGSVHTVYQVNKGVIYPTGITVDHQGNAQISYSVLAIYDGSNAPIVKAGNQALPALTAAATGKGEDKRWTMENFTYDGGTNFITNKKSINIDFGAQTNTEGADSEAFDSWASLDQVLPAITVQGIDPDWLGSVVSLLQGDVIPASSWQLDLKERSTANNVAAHITIAIPGGIARVSDPASATGNDAARTEMRIEPIQVGANLPLGISVEQTI